MPSITSREHYPVILRRIVGQSTDSEVADDLTVMTKELAVDVAADCKLLTIFDLSEAKALTPKQRKMQAEWLLAHKDEIRRISLGSGFLVTSTVVKCVLTGIFWLSPPPDDYVVSADGAVIVRWAEARLLANRLFVPPTLYRAFERRAA